MKRLSSRVRVLLFLAVLFSMFSSTAFAAYYSTYDGSIETYQDFRNGTNNTIGYDADGCYDRQCWDGVQVFYRRLGMSLSTGNVYNSAGDREGYAKHCWDDTNARAVNTGTQFTQITRMEDVKRGDVIVFSGPYYTGHIGFADEDNNASKSTITVWGQNQAGDGSGYYFTAGEFSKSYFLGAFRYNGWATEVRGSEMSQGYDRVLPDGDYIIATAGSEDKISFYYLDIQGDAYPAASEDNVVLCGPVSEDPPVYDIWTITYNSSDKFYTIKQKGTSQCLDIYWADTKQGANVQVCISNNGSAQKWAITHNGNNGYRLQPQCSGAGTNAMCLDISGGIMSSGTNIQQWGINNSKAQSWLFIPYKPSQPIAEGRYIVLWAGAEGVELDVSGDSGDIPNNANVQVWSDTALSQYNSFDFIKLSNGYYKVKNVASGRCLDVSDGLSELKTNVKVHDDNGSIAQQWAIVTNGIGYSLISRCNGYALDLADGNTANGGNVQVYRVLSNTNQRWSFIQAEYTVSYDANGGENGPENQTKYYKTGLVLSNDIPTLNGFTFQGWAESSTATFPDYQPGDSYVKDENITLYAIWKRDYPDPDFILPDNLKIIEDEAFAGCAFQYAYLPEGTEAIGSKAFADCPNLTFIHIPESCTSIAKDAFAGVTGLTIFGQEGSYAEFYASKYGFIFAAK